MIRLLIIAPAYNEQQILPTFIGLIKAFKERQSDSINIKLTIIDDGSTDDTFRILKGYSTQYSWINVIRFYANFGHQAALVAGLREVDNWPHVVVTMDSDCEHPVNLIENLVQQWKQGFLIVHTVRNDHKKLPFFKRIAYSLFYKVTRLLTGLQIQEGQADFCLWDGDLVRVIKENFLQVGSLRIFTAWLKIKKSYVYYDQHIIEGRISRFTFRKNIELAYKSITCYSNAPLRLIHAIGVTGISVSLFYMLQIVFHIVLGEAVATDLIALIFSFIFMGCFQLVCIFILSIYINRLVFFKNLPIYLIQKKTD